MGDLIRGAKKRFRFCDKPARPGSARGCAKRQTAMARVVRPKLKSEVLQRAPLY
jgi:hypothetical protein